MSYNELVEHLKSGTVFCPKNHQTKLIFTSPYISPLNPFGEIICCSCESEIDIKKGFYFCKKCQFDVCLKCQK